MQKNRKKRYMVEENKNIFLSCKKGGGLFLLFGLMVGMGLLYRGNLSYGSKDSYLPKTVYAQEIQSEMEVLPLILYNQKREKIIVKDGTFYETAADFHMALPLSVLEGEQGVEVTVVCKDLESGKCMQKEVLLKAK